jgi:hypothetical protein
MSDPKRYAEIFLKLKRACDEASDRYDAARSRMSDVIQCPTGVPQSDSSLRIRAVFQEVRSALDACQKATNRLAEFASTGIEPEDEDDQKP